MACKNISAVRSHLAMHRLSVKCFLCGWQCPGSGDASRNEMTGTTPSPCLAFTNLNADGRRKINKNKAK
jgi:hypothetical protein